MSRRAIFLSLVLGAALVGTGCSSLPREPAKLRVIVFPGGFNWPLWAAQDRGLFAAQQLDVELTNTPRGRLYTRRAPDIEGIETVLRLHGKYGVPKQELTDVLRYIEPRYEQRAR
jgi:hypothetical protein